MMVVFIMVVALICVSVFVVSRIAPIEGFFHWSPDRWEHDDTPARQPLDHSPEHAERGSQKAGSL